MRRRDFITLLGGAAVAWPLAIRAQQAGKVWRIGVLDTISAASNAANFNALLHTLQEFGYVQGQNLIVEYRSADGRTERFSDLAAELVRLNVDLIVTRGTPAAQAAKRATITTPIVMAASGDPVGMGLVASLAHPGGMVTGLSAVVRDLWAKRVEFLKEIVPSTTETAGIFNLSNPAHPPEWKEVETAAQSLGLRSRLFDVRNLADVRSAFDAAGKTRNATLVIAIDTLTQEHRKAITELAASHKVPAIYASKEFTEVGGLILYGVSYPDLYRRAATYVDKILKGTKPGDLPVQQPTKFELVINLKTAKALGLEVPPMLLARADEVIE